MIIAIVTLAALVMATQSAQAHSYYEYFPPYGKVGFNANHHYAKVCDSRADGWRVSAKLRYYHNGAWRTDEIVDTNGARSGCGWSIYYVTPIKYFKFCRAASSVKYCTPYYSPA